jgi:hypothetical protein
MREPFRIGCAKRTFRGDISGMSFGGERRVRPPDCAAVHGMRLAEIELLDVSPQSREFVAVADTVKRVEF